MATISTLMACMRINRSNAEMLAVVADIAERFSAAVIGVAARQPSLSASVRAVGPGEPRERDVDKFHEHTKAAEAEFRSALSKIANLQWRSQMTVGPLSEYVGNEARGADLVVAALEPGDRIFLPSRHVEVGDLLMRVGRPVLVVPQGVAELKLTRTLVCWKDAREARRAIGDALPLLQSSRRVDVVELVEEDQMEAARRRLADVGDWLSRHHIDADCFAVPASGQEAGQLSTIAREMRVDLIVAGAFGHSRLRDWAFGGVTRDFLLQADRCALMSH